jgi:hypothetical protein
VRSVPTIFHDTFITVARKELFISLGTGNDILEVNALTDYQKDYAVHVTDANGAAVKNVSLIMNLVSLRYFKGFRIFGTPGPGGACSGGLGTGSWVTCYTETGPPTAFYPVPGDGRGCTDEDINHNGVLDVTPVNEDFNGSGRIEAGNIAVVSPRQVVTDDNGTVVVHVVYPQEYAYWLEVALSASTTVQGTEFVRTSTFMLPGLATDFNTATITPPGPISPFFQATSCAVYP